MQRIVTLVVLALTFNFASVVSNAWAQEAKPNPGQELPLGKLPLGKLPLGIVIEKPAQGPSVKVANGYMVPYTAKIPGTDVEFEMVPIPGGKFKMGSPDTERKRNKDEGPQVEVTVEPFWMGKYEVTWGEYVHYMDLDDGFKLLKGKGLRLVTDENKVDAVTAPSSLYDPTFTFTQGGLDDVTEPAGTMTHFAAKQYTKWLTKLRGDQANEFYRLPFEAEWEYACRAGTTTAYYFGDKPSELEDHGFYSANSDEERQERGQLSANPWGLYDMHGNVAELVLGEYTPDGYAHLAGKKNLTVADTYVRPKTPHSLVVRGGSWVSEVEDEVRSASRLATQKEWKEAEPNFPKSPWWFAVEEEPYYGLCSGFRLLRPLNAPKTEEEKNEVWEAGLEAIESNVQYRMDSDGKGSEGIAGPGLPQALKDAKK